MAFAMPSLIGHFTVQSGDVQRLPHEKQEQKMNYLATFHTHFDAVKYHKKMRSMGIAAILKPVPRKLSSSCGSCVSFTSPEELPVEQIFTSDTERLYRVDGDDFVLLGENE